MTISKRLLTLFIALSIFTAQTAQAFSSLTWQPHSDALAAPLKAPLTAKEAAQAEADKKVQDQQRLTEHLNTLAKTPGQEWLGQLAADPKLNVQLKQVSAAAQHWDYSHEGLTPEAAAVVVIVVTYFTAGAASGAGAAIAGAGTATSAAITAGLVTLASQASISLINNKGDLGKTLNDLGQSQNIKALATAMVTAGLLQGLSQNIDIGGTRLSDINAQSGFTQQLQKNLINDTAGAVVNHAINGGDLQSQLEQSLRTAFIDTGSAQSANWIGDQYQNGTLNGYTHQLAHAIAGCAAGAAKAGNCGAGALGAVVGELSAELYGGSRTNSANLDLPGLQTDTVNFARMMAGIAAAITGGDANAINLAASAGGNAAENNYLNHQEVNTLLAKLNACTTPSCKSDLIAAAQKLSNGRNYADLLKKALASDVTDGTVLLQTAINNPDSGLAPNAGFSGYAVNTGLQNLLGINDSQLAAANAVPVLSAPQTAPNPYYDTYQARQAANLSPPLLVAGTAALAAAGGGVLYDLGAAAQTTELTGGVSEISAAKWGTTIISGGAVSMGTNYFLDPNSSPTSLTISAVAGAFGGATKLGLNAAAGLANQWIPTTVDNLITYGSSWSVSHLISNSNSAINQSMNSTTGTPSVTSPVLTCGPYPRNPC